MEARRQGGRLPEIVLISVGLLSCSFLMEVTEVTWSFFMTSFRDPPEPYTAVTL